VAERSASIQFSAHSCMGVPAVYERVIAALRQLDPRRVVLATDYGWTTASRNPAAGFRSHLGRLHADGVKEALLVAFARDNPARLLGFAGWRPEGVR